MHATDTSEAFPDLPSIRAAAALLDGQVMRTPCLPAPRLSRLTGAQVFVKYENMQVTNSFKERGAFVKLSTLTEAERKRGVIAMSAGNHAQAVAYNATRMRIPSTIVMPVTTPYVKVAATRAHGAKVVLHGETLVESHQEVERLIAAHGYVLVHPYDDPDVVRGAGTIALEMLEDADLETLIVPIGGGGLIGGMALAAKAVKPSIEVIGVEAKLYPSMWSVLHGVAAKCGGNTLAEGIAVKNVGALTARIARQHVDDVILVDEPQIERAVNAYLTLQKTLAEGAGAAGLAAMFASPDRFRGRNVGLVLCGGNIDPRLCASIMVRELAREEKIIAIRITIPDRPGVLATIADTIGKLGGNILDVEHHRMFLKVPAKGASLDVTIETRDGNHGTEITVALEALGFTVERLNGLETEF